MRIGRAGVGRGGNSLISRKLRSPRGRFDPQLLESLESRLLLSTVMYPTHVQLIPADGSPANSSSPVGLTPSQVRQAYGFNQLFFGNIVGDGSGQTIAIVDAYDAPNIIGDLHTFDQTFGLSDPNITVINQNGGTTRPQTDPAGPGFSWASETSLDVEWVHSIAPGADIVLVLADSASDADLLQAVDTARNLANVSVVSMSFGAVENGLDLQQASFYTTPVGHTGITFVASTGDFGAFGTGGSAKAVQMPAALPTVVAVGGTTLTLDVNGDYLSEAAWGTGATSGVAGGAGGGISTLVPQPAYQQGVVTQSTDFRTVPDVSFLADPFSGVAVYDSWDNPLAPWSTVGGTSLAAPMFSGLMGIVNQGVHIAGANPLDGATQTLPRIYSIPSGDFHDVTTGNNGFAAGVGYDLVTGRGTPIPSSFVPDMISQIAIGSLTAGDGATTIGASVDLVAHNVTANGGAAVTSVKFFRESNGVPGLQPDSDQAIGVGIKSRNNWTLATTTRMLPPGTYTYYAVAQNSLNVITSAPLSATLTLVTPTIGSFTVAPPATGGSSGTLTASNVTEDAGGTVASVTFYLENGANPGLQIGQDTAITGVQNGTTWTAPTGNLPNGTYTFYAVATDILGATSSIATAVFTLTAPPANDNFANAAIMNGTLSTMTAATFTATKEKGEPAAIAGNAGGRSAWYKWVAPASGQVSLDTAGSDFDTLLGVYTGTKVSKLKLVAANDNAPALSTSALSFHAVAGATYYFVVDGFNGAGGNVVINLSQAAAPVNDDFAHATNLGNAPFNNVAASNVGGSLEAGEPTIAGQTGGASVWFKWTAPSAGTFNLTTNGSDFSTILGVYTGTKLSKLKLVQSSGDGNSGLTFTAKAGVTYYFVVDGLNGAAGNILLSLS